MKKSLTSLLALSMVASLAACSSSTTATEEETAAEETVAAVEETEGVSGTFSGTGSGKGGDINVDVTLEDSKITAITVTSHNESDIISEAMDIITEEMIEANSTSVDSVSGATLTSSGFKMAVNNAIKESGATLVANEVPAHVAEAVEGEYDVVVVGAGGAGLSAAITAAEAGASVAVVEQLKLAAGSTLLSGAEMAAPGNWLQEEGTDSPEQLVEDMLNGGGNIADVDLVTTLANNALDGAEWLRDDVGVEWQDELMHFGGHSVTRSLVPEGATGEELMTKLRAKAEELGVTFYYDTKAETIVMEDGKAVGIEGSNTEGNGDTLTLTANNGVILATGGFGSNIEMREEFNPNYGEGYKSTDSVGSNGSGIEMAEAVGANLVDMQYIQTYPYCDPISGGLLYIDDARLYGDSIIVNLEGERFVSELDTRDVMSEAILNQTGQVCYEVIDSTAWEKDKIEEHHGGEVEYMYAMNELVKADTLEEAAEFFGIDAEALVETVEKYNSYVDSGVDEDFGRGSLNGKIETAPFYIVVATPAVHHTMGGVQINTDAEVIDTDGNVIDGLYAAGEVTGGIHGTNRLGSCAIADITVFGRIAGANAAAANE